MTTQAEALRHIENAKLAGCERTRIPCADAEKAAALATILTRLGYDVRLFDSRASATAHWLRYGGPILFAVVVGLNGNTP